MDEMQRKAFEAGRNGESMPRDRGATTEEIRAYFDGVLEKQEREARELGYGERLTSVERAAIHRKYGKRRQPQMRLLR
jgi:hypothetical protein